tara:strand:+ start:1693 stop:2799 length:1107 start_codon:yes stop_codon:yes gene_type:complete
MNPIEKVQLLGQSIWYDNINRELINNGYIKNLLDIGITGLTSNPTLFEKAISNSKLYDQDLLNFSKSDLSTEQIFEELAVEDIRSVAALLHPIYEKTNKKDGYVSLEVNPKLAFDSNKTILEAKRLYNKLDCPNIMIKVPGTDEGVIALEALISEGININVTLIFSQRSYSKVREGYILGLEKFEQKGGDLSQVHSVASFFISRVDTIIDKQLNGLSSSFNKVRQKLLNCIGISNAKIAYEEFNKTFNSERFNSLLAKGANVQRPLWASTSTKNPDLSDVLYIDSLIGNNTVNTIPDNTLKAFVDHGSNISTLNNNVAEAKSNIQLLASVEINLEKYLDLLLIEGIKSFTQSYEELISNIETKIKSLI